MINEEKMLEEKNLKKTSHRLLILDILKKSERFLSADDVYMNVTKEDKGISLSTVYIILETFTGKGIVSAVNVEFSKKVLYELSHETHGHRLICTNCHKVVYVEECPVHTFEDKIRKEYDFDIKRHKLDFYGLCKECQAELNV